MIAIALGLMSTTIFYLRSWYSRLIPPIPTGRVGEIVSLDGKVLRGSHDRFHGKDAVTMVNAWASAAGLALALRDVPEGTNEIATVPEVLKQLVLTDCIVTMDAAHCQVDAKRTRIVIEQKGDYAYGTPGSVLALKENQGNLYAEVQLAFEVEQKSNFKGIRHETHTSRGKNHGRIETRRHVLLTDAQYLDYFNRDGKWWGLAGGGHGRTNARAKR